MSNKNKKEQKVRNKAVKHKAEYTRNNGRKSEYDPEKNRRIQHRKRSREEKKRGVGKKILITLIVLVMIAGICAAGFFYYQRYGKPSTEDMVELGVSLMQQKDYQGAVEYFAAAITNEEQNQEKGRGSETRSGTAYMTEAYRGMGMAYYELQDYEQARINLQQVIDAGGDVTPILYNILGISSMNLGDYDEALRAFEVGTALPAAGTYQDVGGTEQSVDYSAVIQEMKFNRVVCFEKKLDWANAKVEMEAYIAAYPDDLSAQKEAEFLATR